MFATKNLQNMAYQNNFIKTIECLDFLGAIIAVYRIPLTACGLLPPYNTILQLIPRNEHLPPINKGANYHTYMDIKDWLYSLLINNNLPAHHSRIQLQIIRNKSHHYNMRNQALGALNTCINVQVLIDYLEQRIINCEVADDRMQVTNHIRLTNGRFDGIIDFANDLTGILHWLGLLRNQCCGFGNEIQAETLESTQVIQSESILYHPISEKEEIIPSKIIPSNYIGQWKITFWYPIGNKWIEGVAYSNSIDHLETIQFEEGHIPTHAMDSVSLNGDPDNITNSNAQLYIIEKGRQYKLDKLETAQNETKNKTGQELYSKDGIHFQIRFVKHNGGNTRNLPVTKIEYTEP
jgi:hypothetical protein